MPNIIQYSEPGEPRRASGEVSGADGIGLVSKNTRANLTTEGTLV